MTEHKWTPGPWFYQEGYLNIYSLSNGDGGVTTHIAKFNYEQVDGGYDEAESNALLSSAAPDLYDALDRARQKLVSEGFFNASYDCDAALAKARGESC